MSCGLEILLEKAKPTRVILVGDMFTKGANLAVWGSDNQMEHGAVFGNHEAKVVRAYH